MYHCYEIYRRVFDTAEELNQAVRSHGFCGGMVRDFDINKIAFSAISDRRKEILDYEFGGVKFNYECKYRIVYYPNGASNCITIYKQ